MALIWITTGIGPTGLSPVESPKVPIPPFLQPSFESGLDLWRFNSIFRVVPQVLQKKRSLKKCRWNPHRSLNPSQCDRWKPTTLETIKRFEGISAALRLFVGIYGWQMFRVCGWLIPTFAQPEDIPSGTLAIRYNFVKSIFCIGLSLN